MAQGAVHHSSEPAGSYDGPKHPFSPEPSSLPDTRSGFGNFWKLQSDGPHECGILLSPNSRLLPHRCRHLWCPRKPQHYLKNKNVQAQLYLYHKPTTHISISSDRKLQYSVFIKHVFIIHLLLLDYVEIPSYKCFYNNNEIH